MFSILKKKCRPTSRIRHVHFACDTAW